MKCPQLTDGSPRGLGTPLEDDHPDASRDQDPRAPGAQEQPSTLQ